MSELHDHDYHSKASPDVSPRANTYIWFYLLLLGVLLFVTILGLTIYFKFALADEEEKKIGNILTNEIIDYKAHYKPILNGEKSILNGKKSISIEEAMHKLLTDIKNGQ